MEEILKEIMVELKYHSKLLGELVMGVDARSHDQQEKKLEIAKMIEDVAGKMNNTPFAPLLQNLVKKINGQG